MAKTKLRIAIDARNIGTSTGRYMQQLLTNLEPADSHNSYEVIVKPNEKRVWRSQARNFKLSTLDATEYTLGEQTTLLKYLRRGRFDLVHFTLPQHPILYFRPFVITIHDLTMINFTNRRDVGPLQQFIKYWLKPRIFKFVIWHGVKFSRLVIVPSQNTKAELLNTFKINPNKIVVTYEAADKLAALAKPLEQLKSSDFILYVGNAFPYKNLWRLVEAFAKLKSQHPNLKLVLAGKTDYFYEELAARVATSQIPDVVFTDWVDNAELKWLYQKAKLYVFPSLSEGFGLPGLEAMYHDLPVVAAKASCIPEIYGSAAAYFDPKDAADMARVITKVLKEPALQAKLQTRGRQLLKKYSWQRMASQTLEVYKSALNQK